MKFWVKLLLASRQMSGALVVLLSIGATGCVAQPVAMVSGTIPPPDKVMAPVAIHYQVPERAEIGDKVFVQVEVVFERAADAVEIVFKGGGLDLLAGEVTSSYGTQGAGEVVSKTVAVQVEQAGTLYLHIFVSGDFSGRTMTRAGSIPIRVGADQAEQLKKLGEQQRDTRGRLMRLVPAEER